MITNKQAKLLGRKQTINLKYINARDYCDEIELGNPKDKAINYGYIALHYIGMFTIAFIISFGIFALFIAKTSANLDLQTQIRQDRLNTCEQAYKESGIKEKHINYDMLIVRCATYSTLIYAYESNFGKSERCLRDRNCHGLKMPTNRNLLKGINYRVTGGRFLVFDSYHDNNLVFARSYFTYHYKKDTTTYIRGYLQADGTYAFGYSMTDTATYIHFIDSNYRAIYNQLERLYFNY